MKPGFAFSVRVGNIKFDVRYTSHFVDMFSKGDPKESRLPASNLVDEQMVAKYVQDAIFNDIHSICQKDPDAKGIIHSISSKTNIVFVLIRHSSKQFKIICTTIMVKDNFQKIGAREYFLRVNPKLHIVFMSKSVPPILKEIVAWMVLGKHKSMNIGTEYSYNDGFVSYIAERTNGKVVVDDAAYVDDVWEIEV